MKDLTSAQIRQMYLDFFKQKGHKIEPSASLVPVDDPTLLWINSGVATMKKYFDGTVVPENKRMTSSQKSIRTNDIENVGRTARHHTMFEMLGNFSIGDYFKPEAIAWAWEFLTSPNWMAFDPEKLYVTVYPEDKDAKRLWMETGVSEDHIVEIEDNFWDIGAGPCGPDSEIFYDRGQKYNDVDEDDPENYPGGENERYLEIWNLVFSEFNHTPEHTYEPLPQKNIDTGMGLERMVSIVQDAKTNFETDLFMPMINQTAKISGKFEYNDSEMIDVSFKVIADHIRAVTFAIGDGALPSNEGRGYVLRRLLRRAVMHGKKLGINEPFMYKLVPTVGEVMKAYYPEILEKQEFIANVIKKEEERFHETINDGLHILEEIIKKHQTNGQDTLEGEIIFKLYDTYGFPVELTEEVAHESGLKVDHESFEKEMEKQRSRARNARSNEQSMAVQSNLLTNYTEESIYVGYVESQAAAKLMFAIQNEEVVQAEVTAGKAQVIFNQTPFYAEMGGQIADTGVIKFNDEVVAKVIDVKKAPNGQPLHTVEVLKPLNLGCEYELEIDKERHQNLERNHTATHLLHQALRDVLGDHANQAGSLVTENYLRFDFNHFGQVTKDELVKMEQIVNEKIWASLPVQTIETNLESAKAMGAMALFGEKYGHDVRVVNIDSWSIELCGGTHVKNTNELGLFKILSETGVGAGIRRIEAVTSKKAFEAFKEQESLLEQVAKVVKAPQLVEVPHKVEQLHQQVKTTQKEIEELQQKVTNIQAKNIFDDVKEVNGITYIASKVAVSDMSQLRQLADQWKQKAYSNCLVLALSKNNKVNLLVAMDKELNDKGLKAGDLIKEIAPLVGGGGGGRPDMAQAGGSKPEGIMEAFSKVREWLAAK